MDQQFFSTQPGADKPEGTKDGNNRFILFGILLIVAGVLYAVSYIERYWVATTFLTVLACLGASVPFFFKKLNLPVFIASCALIIFASTAYIPLAILLGFNIFGGKEIVSKNRKLFTILFWVLYGIFALFAVISVASIYDLMDIFYGTSTLLSIAPHFVIIAMLGIQLLNDDLSPEELQPKATPTAAPTFKTSPVFNASVPLCGTDDYGVENKIKLIARIIDIIGVVFLSLSLIAMIVLFILYAVDDYSIYLILACTIPVGGFVICISCKVLYHIIWGYGHLIGNTNRIVMNTAMLNPNSQQPVYNNQPVQQQFVPQQPLYNPQPTQPQYAPQQPVYNNQPVQQQYAPQQPTQQTSTTVIDDLPEL